MGTRSDAESIPVARFLAAQGESPFDSESMLTWADHLEESGDLVGAASLRGLAAAGIPSLHALSLDAALISHPWSPDQFKSFLGYGRGDGAFGSRDVFGGGYGDTFDFLNRSWHGDGCADRARVADEDRDYDEPGDG